MRIVTGHQPTYLPWLGLFHKIALADVFVFMDDTRFGKRDWLNRNRVLGATGPFWLTVPVAAHAGAAVRDVVLDTTGWDTDRRHWQVVHWEGIRRSYAAAPYWEEQAPFFEELYRGRAWTSLADLNEHVLRHLLRVLRIDVEFVRASEVGFEGRKSELVLDHCRRLRADACVLGTHGRDYLDERSFLAAGVSVYYQDYRHPTYAQTRPGFESHLSVLDLLFNHGPSSRDVLLAENVSKEWIKARLTRAGTPVVLQDEPDVPTVRDR